MKAEAVTDSKNLRKLKKLLWLGYGKKKKFRKYKSSSKSERNRIFSIQI